jgi:microcystin-dependent protein
MPSHTHSFFPLVTADANNGGANGVQYGTTASVATTSTGGDAPHNNLPPFYGVYFIKRTARVYYTK